MENQHTTNQRYKFLVRSVRRLLTFLLKSQTFPSTLVLRELALTVREARNVYGKQLVDETIARDSKEADDRDTARAAGLCEICFTEPVFSNLDRCSNCLRQDVDDESSLIIELG